MDIEQVKQLARLGVAVECHSPLEIRDEDGNFATGKFAKMVIDKLLNNSVEVR